MLRLASDSDAGVRFQVACTLGEIAGPRAIDALATIARRDASDPWIRTAVLSSVANTSDQLLTRLLADAKLASSGAATELIRELAQIVGVRGQTPEMQRVLTSLYGFSGVRPSPGAATPGKELTAAPSTTLATPKLAVAEDLPAPSLRQAGGHTPLNTSTSVGLRGEAGPALREVVSGIGEGLKRSGKSLRRVEWEEETSSVIGRLLSQAARTAADSQAPLEARTAAIRLLTFDDFERVHTALAGLLEVNQPQEVQRAAVTAIGSFTLPETAPLLLARWRTGTPTLRAEIVLAMLGGRNRLLPLLQAIENGVIPASQVPFARRALLLRSTDAQVKALATKVLGDAAPGPRKEVIAKYQGALSMKGDAVRGRKVFETSCATCHRAGDLGKDVGPNLATIRQWNPDQVLSNILDPNREVAPNFVGYTVETRDGRTLDGIIAEENAASLTLKRAEGVTETVLRRDIAQLSGSGLSLMPEGLETAVTIEQMADLIAFLLPTP
jgi:putative heme-binding domain-containing protein